MLNLQLRETVMNIINDDIRQNIISIYMLHPIGPFPQKIIKPKKGKVLSFMGHNIPKNKKK